MGNNFLTPKIEIEKGKEKIMKTQTENTKLKGSSSETQSPAVKINVKIIRKTTTKFFLITETLLTLL
jgi:hypothetical protein